MLARAGFLAPEPARRGACGAVERPYRSTGKSSEIRLPRSTSHSLNVLDAFRDELGEAGEDAVVEVIRLGVRRRPADVEELRRRLLAIGDDFVARRHPHGERVGIVVAAHRVGDDRA